MKTNQACATCGFLVCWVCLGHKFPASEAGIERSDKKHGGEKKQPCTCGNRRHKKARPGK